MTKTVRISEWRAWEIVIPASKESACVKKDPDSNECWKWISGGKRVTVKRVIL